MCWILSIIVQAYRASTSTRWHFAFALCCHSNATRAPSGESEAERTGTQFHGPWNLPSSVPRPYKALVRAATHVPGPTGLVFPSGTYTFWRSWAIIAHHAQHSKLLTHDHSVSAGHKTALSVLHSREQQQLKIVVENQMQQQQEETCRVLRTVYYVAQSDRPYTDQWSPWSNRTARAKWHQLRSCFTQ